MKPLCAAFLAAFLGLAAPALADNLPAGAKLEKDIAYGTDRAQKLDVYLPAHAKNAPILFMVHGGGWRRGDKDMDRVVDNKVARWLPKGIIFVTVNYRMDETVTPVMEADDVAAALVKVQQLAPGWGGDPGNVILMGHSAGAHLVTLINSAPEIATAKGARMWRGTISLDSGAMNVPEIMQGRHFRLYDDAFGKDPAAWEAASPYHRLKGPTQPLLGICRQRSADACPQNRQLARKAVQFGGKMEVQPEAITHGEINSTLGLPGAYTERVEAFMRALGWPV
ncbi:alpha/beta hydrolase [Dongia rigui]|uniref:Alpha/beta hydrolase n=1 Tax=Dongia rigui TaxID=940149 RepID=A0ABU5DYL2_9PROT|nr:alpha/beta hydrolase [Dongia rigui]MDY0871651.1 alpha/beta hydrolase [Dongia rigui]